MCILITKKTKDLRILVFNSKRIPNYPKQGYFNRQFFPLKQCSYFHGANASDHPSLRLFKTNLRDKYVIFNK